MRFDPARNARKWRRILEVAISRKVLVTAGASGIGKAIAAAFLTAGNHVYACDINADA